MNICIIPARWNSSRFPGKLLVVVQGKTILQRTFECALASKKIDELFVATDDQRIADHVHSFGGRVLWTSSTCKNGTERISEALQKESRLQEALMVINLQGDHPCTSPHTLDRVAHLLMEDPSLDVGTAARPIRTKKSFLSPHVVKCVLDKNGRALYFSRSPIPHRIGSYPQKALLGYHHIGLYAYRTSFLLQMASLPETDLQQAEDLEQLKFLELGFAIKVAIVEDEALGIDMPQDLATLEKILCRSNTSSLPAASFLHSAKA